MRQWGQRVKSEACLWHNTYQPFYDPHCQALYHGVRLSISSAFLISFCSLNDISFSRSIASRACFLCSIICIARSMPSLSCLLRYWHVSYVIMLTPTKAPTAQLQHFGMPPIKGQQHSSDIAELHTAEHQFHTTRGEPCPNGVKITLSDTGL